VEAMAGMEPCSVDAVVCDPPAGIAFMGKAWDHHRGGRNQWVEWMAEVLREALRVCKPGAHAFVWALPRTSHWTGSALELAGWEVRDVVTHLFGSGFPKSHNLPNGFGTALKPAAEFWWLARKPLAGTVAGNVLATGCGALNIDACRIEGEGPGARTSAGGGEYQQGANSFNPIATDEHPAGRWPANVVLDEGAAGLLDEQTGELSSHGGGTRSGMTDLGWGFGDMDKRIPAGDTGGASRFFYVAKASRGERNAGLEGFEEKRRSTSYGNMGKRRCRVCGTKAAAPGAGGRWPNCEHNDWEWAEQDEVGIKGGNAQNVHPTVKPIELMRWLVRLVTPPGGTVLDPFTGSGTTGCAAALEGFDFIGIEREDEYAAIAEARIAWWERHRGDGKAEAVLKAGSERDAVELTGQSSLFDLEDAA
jgi:DNA modification methylase